MKKTLFTLLFGIMLLGMCTLPCGKVSAAEKPKKAKSQTLQTSQENVMLPVSLRQKKKFASTATLGKYKRNIFQSDTSTLTIHDIPEDCSVSFKSSDTSILSVEQDSDTSCQYTGVRSGNAKIIVKISKTNFFFFEEKRVLKANITVSPRAASIMFHQSVRKLRKGQTAKLAVTLRPSITKEMPIFWSANKQIATIGKKGVVRARKTGTTYVMARIANGKTAKCKIIVRKKKKPKTVTSPSPDNL